MSLIYDVEIEGICINEFVFLVILEVAGLVGISRGVLWGFVHRAHFIEA